MAAVAGVAFVAVQDGHSESLAIGQRLVSLQTFVDLVNAFPELIGGKEGVYPSDGVGAGPRLSQTAFPEAGGSGHFQGVEAAQPSPEQNQGGVEDAGRGDAGFLPAVRDGGQDLGGEAEDLFGIGDQAAKKGSGLPFLEPFPF